MKPFSRVCCRLPLPWQIRVPSEVASPPSRNPDLSFSPGVFSLTPVFGEIIRPFFCNPVFLVREKSGRAARFRLGLGLYSNFPSRWSWCLGALLPGVLLDRLLFSITQPNFSVHLLLDLFSIDFLRHGHLATFDGFTWLFAPIRPFFQAEFISYTFFFRLPSP